MRTSWYEHFFHGLALEFWRRAVTPQETERDADFIESELGLPKMSRILDVPCGNGRHSVALGRRGYRMTAADLSEEFVGEARQTANQNGVQIDCLPMDMREIRFDCEFDGAFCFGNSFGYMDRPANKLFLERVSRHLKPGGKFVLETAVTAESLLPALQPRRWHRLGDITVLSENRYEATESELHTEYTFIRGALSESGTATYSVYTVAELKSLFTSCGFEVTALYGSKERQPYRLGDRLFMTGKKR